MDEKFIDKYLDTDKYDYEVHFTEDEGHQKFAPGQLLRDLISSLRWVVMEP